MKLFGNCDRRALDRGIYVVYHVSLGFLLGETFGSLGDDVCET